MNAITAFGGYSFNPDNQISYQDNFSQLALSAVKFATMDGGLDQYGTGRAPTDIGLVQQSIMLFGTYPGEIAERLDTLLTIAGQGVQTLKMKTTASAERTCQARIRNIEHSQRAELRPDLRLRVSIAYQVTDPFWYGTAKSVTGQTGSNLQTDLTAMSVAGSAITYPKFTITPATAISGIKVQRIVSSAVVDEVAYNASVSGALIIDCANMAVTIGSNDAYDSNFDYKRGRWFALAPGSNSVRILLSAATDGFTMKTEYTERWR